jgi:hypothetical protein
MLSILNSNQPVAWAFVPLSGLALFLGMCGLNLVELHSWTALLAICVSAWLLHQMHLESGMRTRPGSIPGWVWVLVATPALGMMADATWWVFPCFFQGLRKVLTLREGERRPVTFMFIAMWWCAGVLLEASAWPLLPAFMVAMLLVRRPGEEEILALLLGLAAPWLLTGTIVWLTEGALRPFWAWRPELAPGVLLVTLWLAVPTAVGWMARQRSLRTATAQQRFSRQLTQWAGLLGVLFLLLTEAWDWSMTEAHFNGGAAFPGALAFLAAWSWPWLMPPGKRWTKVAVYAFAVMSAGVVFIRYWLGV